MESLTIKATEQGRQKSSELKLDPEILQELNRHDLAQLASYFISMRIAQIESDIKQARENENKAANILRQSADQIKNPAAQQLLQEIADKLSSSPTSPSL